MFMSEEVGHINTGFVSLYCNWKRLKKKKKRKLEGRPQSQSTLLKKKKKGTCFFLEQCKEVFEERIGIGLRDGRAVVGACERNGEQKYLLYIYFS